MSIIRIAIRSKFAVTSRTAANRMIEVESRRTLEAVESVSDGEAARPVKVCPMAGIDEDMRNWSLFMLLEHNTIVNGVMTGIVSALARGVEYHSAMDPKKDVLPSADAGSEQIDQFRVSVEKHLSAVVELGDLRKTATRPHPIFGPFTAHQWHCMFGFHLMLHRRQAEAIVKLLQAKLE